MVQSNIAVIVYDRYTENVDMNNQHFSLDELTELFLNDKDIIKVEFLTGGHVTDVWTRKNRKTAGALQRYEKAVALVTSIENEVTAYYKELNLEVDLYSGHHRWSKELDKASKKDHAIFDEIRNIMQEKGEVNLNSYEIISNSYSLCPELFTQAEEEALQYYRENRTEHTN